MSEEELNDFVLTFAKREMCDEYAPEVEKILEILGHPEAFVTDESTLSDFCYPGRPIPNVLKDYLGYGAYYTDKLWELAKELRKMNA